jgi:hypothetical protein
MGIRTNDEAVRAAIETSSTINTAPFIKRANALTNYVASRDTAGLLTAELLFEIETNLAAHFYARRDPQFRSKSTGGASGQFQGQSGMGLEATDWGQDAILLDITGTLNEMNSGRSKASLLWLGTPYEST